MFKRIKKLFKGERDQKEIKVSEPKLLAKILIAFPLPEPSRIIEGGGDDWLAEWHLDGNYFEIECYMGKLEIMSQIGSNTTHWVMKKT